MEPATQLHSYTPAGAAEKPQPHLSRTRSLPVIWLLLESSARLSWFWRKKTLHAPELPSPELHDGNMPLLFFLHTTFSPRWQIHDRKIEISHPSCLQI